VRHLLATRTALSLRMGSALGSLLETASLARVGSTSTSLRLATPRTSIRLHDAQMTQTFWVRYPAADDSPSTIEMCGQDGNLALALRPPVGHDARAWDHACARLLAAARESKGMTDR
jgi:hypothetical protein